MDLSSRKMRILGDAHDDYMKSMGTLTNTSTSSESWTDFFKSIGRDTVKAIFTPPQSNTVIYKNEKSDEKPSMLMPALFGVAAIGLIVFALKK